MTPYTYLRRNPSPGADHRTRLRWVIATLAAILVSAAVDNSGSVRVTSLTRSIQADRATIQALESELSYLVRQQGSVEGRAVIIDRLQDVGERFGTPDSGHVVFVATR